MTLNRREFLGTGMAVVTLGTKAKASEGDAVRPEDFGAAGDGITNDTEAFAAMSEHINRRGGGTIVLRRTTYLVGRQQLGKTPTYWAYLPGKIIEVQNLARPLVIEGNGARLKCPAGLRFGTFDRESGTPTKRSMPNFNISEIASPYLAMISVTGCTGPITIDNLELDGSLGGLRVGGPYGDTGHQLPATGLLLRNNAEAERITNLHTHHHGQDGIMIDGLSSRSSRSRFQNVVSEYNGRQGLSLVGGRGYDFSGCTFARSGRSAIMSAPGAGVDIEAEGEKTVRDVTFENCAFVDNAGCGLVADSGDSRDARFTRCTFIGTTSWSAWPRKPLFRFDECLFVGALVQAPAEADPQLRASFQGCTFSDDPKRSPTGKVYVGSGSSGPIADLNEYGNPIFVSCAFTLVDKGLLPWSIQATYENCTMSQTSPLPAYPRGTYLGRNTIVGPVDLYSSQIVGEVMVNGNLIAQSRA